MDFFFFFTIFSIVCFTRASVNSKIWLNLSSLIHTSIKWHPEKNLFLMRMFFKSSTCVSQPFSQTTTFVFYVKRKWQFFLNHHFHSYHNSATKHRSKIQSPCCTPLMLNKNIALSVFAQASEIKMHNVILHQLFKALRQQIFVQIEKYWNTTSI